jgi:uncharacterized surface protein with fasciclin (FAS1) repeats
MGTFNTLVSLIETTGLTNLLTESGPITVFAPTDEAFTKLPHDMTEELKRDLLKLKQVIAYHLVTGDVRSDDLAQIDEAPTVEGSVIAVNHDTNGRVTLNEATVIEMDTLVDNGVIHTIDAVLMPAMIAGHS